MITKIIYSVYTFPTFCGECGDNARRFIDAHPEAFFAIKQDAEARFKKIKATEQNITWEGDKCGVRIALYETNDEGEFKYKLDIREWKHK